MIGQLGFPSVDSYKIYKDFTNFLENNFNIENNNVNEIDINSLIQRLNTTTDPKEKQRLLEIQRQLYIFYMKAIEEGTFNRVYGVDDFYKFMKTIEEDKKIFVYKQDNFHIISSKKPTEEELKLISTAQSIIKEYIPAFNTRVYIVPGIQDNNAAHANREGKSFIIGGKYNNKDLFTKSDDTFSHELGHFILEELNPKFKNAFSLEAKTIHESFADTVAFLQSSKDKSNREKLNLTNLYSKNPVSVIGEMKDSNDRIIRRLYDVSDYKKLKEDKSVEEHSLSVPITESMYRGWAYLVERSMKEGKSKDEAIDYATSTMQNIIRKAAQKTDTNIKSYLQSIIQSTSDQELQKILITEFSKRNLPYK